MVFTGLSLLCTLCSPSSSVFAICPASPQWCQTSEKPDRHRTDVTDGRLLGKHLVGSAACMRKCI